MRLMRMRDFLMIPAAGLSLLVALPGQAQWQMQGGHMRTEVVVVGENGERTSLPVLPGERVAAPPGASWVHFPRNANGKPASLQVDVADHDLVNVAVDVAQQAAPITRLVRLDRKDGIEATLVSNANALPFQVIVASSGDAQLRDYRVGVLVEKSRDTVAAGLVARYALGRGCYLFSIDWAARKARLERWMGEDHVVVQQVDTPWLSPEHRLAMQVDGFRLQCLIDDEIVIQSFDGAFAVGAPGLAWIGGKPVAEWLTVEPIAPLLASAALVQSQNRARLSAAVAVLPGHITVLQLSLDWPHPYVPRSLAGLEPSLMQRPAAPTVAWGDWRSSLGPNSVGEVGFDGQAAADIVWPDLVGLRGQAALAQLLLVSPDGARVVDSTPPVSVIF
jgi:hypothetical protein